MSHIVEYLSAATLLALLFWLPGYVLERNIAILRDPGGVERPDLRRLARWCLGLGFWIAVTFLALSFGQLKGVLVASVAGSMVLGTIWTVIRERPRFTFGLGQAKELLPSTVLPALALTPLLLMALSTWISWDASAYHLTLPRLYLEHGGFTLVEFNVYSNWPLATEMLFTIAMLLKGFVLAKLVHFGFGLLTLMAIHSACLSLGSGRVTTVVALALFFGQSSGGFRDGRRLR